MKIKFIVLVVAVLALFFTNSCSSNSSTNGGSKNKISGNARFLNGATTRATRLLQTKAIHPSSAPAAGTWFLTPDQMTLTVLEINFMDGSGGSSRSTVDCQITADQARPSLATLSDCAFTVDEGTYTSVGIMVSTIVSLRLMTRPAGFSQNLLLPISWRHLVPPKL